MNENPWLNPTFIAAATASVIAIIGALGGILLKLYSLARETERGGAQRLALAEKTHTAVNGGHEAVVAKLDSANEAILALTARLTAALSEVERLRSIVEPGVPRTPFAPASPTMFPVGKEPSPAAPKGA